MIHQLDFLRTITWYSILVRLLLAFCIGAAVGIERELRGRAAGLRTHILVCVGACLTETISFYIVEYLDVNTDAVRLAAQVIPGIGFLGAGTILVIGRSNIRGLTTAAGLWTTAILGIAAGAGFFEGAILVGVGTMFALTGLNTLEGRLNIKKDTINLYLEVDGANWVNAVLDELRKKNYKLKSVEASRGRSGLEDHIGIEGIVIISGIELDREAIIDEIQNMEHVVYAIEIF
ncbi:MAG: MgtC/SapB family protein [Lachnospiraceae bacterium]|nr:MgtC/SapB family protein [Lachnospiraceae bacterium]